MFDCPDSLYDASCACTINLHTCIIKKKTLHEYFETMNVACYVYTNIYVLSFQNDLHNFKMKNQNEYINRKFEKYKFKPYLNSFTCEYIRCTACTPVHDCF